MSRFTALSHDPVLDLTSVDTDAAVTVIELGSCFSHVECIGWWILWNCLSSFGAQDQFWLARQLFERVLRYYARHRFRFCEDAKKVILVEVPIIALIIKKLTDVSVLHPFPSHIDRDVVYYRQFSAWTSLFVAPRSSSCSSFMCFLICSTLWLAYIALTFYFKQSLRQVVCQHRYLLNHSLLVFALLLPQQLQLKPT